jgi:hypothetical protein
VMSCAAGMLRSGRRLPQLHARFTAIREPDAGQFRSQIETKSD